MAPGGFAASTYPNKTLCLTHLQKHLNTFNTLKTITHFCGGPMPRKQPKKKTPKPSSKKKPSKKPPKKTKVKKAAARSAVRKAVARRAKKTKKQATRKATKKKATKKKPVKKVSKKVAKMRSSKKPAKKKRVKKTAKKTVKKTTKKKTVRKKTSRKVTKKKEAKKKITKKKVKVATKHKKKKTTKKTTPKKRRVKTVLRKPAARKKSSLRKKPTKKKPAKKAAKKTARLKTAKKKPVSPKPKIKEKKPPARGPERTLNKAEISKLLSDAYARHLIIESGGEHALEIVRGFNNNSSDEEMSKKLGIKISDVRATLNKLHSLGIVDYTRHKDSETGWFSYYWCLNVNRMKGWINDRVEEERRKQDFSSGEHYFCPSCGGASIHDFVSASDFGFKCPICSSALDFLSEERAAELFPMKVFRKPLL